MTREHHGHHGHHSLVAMTTNDYVHSRIDPQHRIIYYSRVPVQTTACPFGLELRAIPL